MDVNPAVWNALLPRRGATAYDATFETVVSLVDEGFADHVQQNAHEYAPGPVGMHIRKAQLIERFTQMHSISSRWRGYVGREFDKEQLLGPSEHHLPYNRPLKRCNRTRTIFLDSVRNELTEHEQPVKGHDLALAGHEATTGVYDGKPPPLYRYRTRYHIVSQITTCCPAVATDYALHKTWKGTLARVRAPSFSASSSLAHDRSARTCSSQDIQRVH